MNFCKAFANEIFPLYDFQSNDLLCEQTPMRIIADNCERKTIKMLMGTGIPVTVTNFGNAGSLRKAFEVALDEGDDDDMSYFCEDDYLHLGVAPSILKEGLGIADYITLYDHPDKYTQIYGGGEVSKVMRTKSSHWRFTQSTCMTFGSKIGTLRKDMEVWDKWIKGEHPHDHKIFTELSEKKRQLAVCIPGVACHTDLTFSGSVNNIMIDTWAIDLMIDHLERAYNFDEKLYKSIVGNKIGWSKLIALDSMRYDKEKTNQD